MATRFYFPLAGAAPSSPTIDANWERSIAAFARYKAVTTKQNTALTDIASLFGATTSTQTCWHQWVSDPLDVNQTITGTASVIVRCLEGGATEDAHLAVILRVMQGNTSTARGTLISRIASTTEFPTGTAATRIHSGVAVTSVAAQAGDRLCAEVGVVGVTPNNTNVITLRFGDPSGTGDFAMTAGLTTDLCPYWELSQNITFAAPPPPAYDFVGAQTRRRGRYSTLLKL